MSDGSENSDIPQSMRYPIWLGRTIISFAHLSLHCTSQWILLMLNDSWLAMISIISPENGAVRESWWKRSAEEYTRKKRSKGRFCTCATISLRKRDLDSHSLDCFEAQLWCSLTQNSWASKLLLLLLRVWILDGTDPKPFIQQMALMRCVGE